MKHKHTFFSLALTLGLLLALSILLVTTVLATPAAPRACVAGPHSGVISANEEWCAADNPHVLTGDVTITSGVTLTIESGVVVQGQSGVELKVLGHLQAIGSQSQPITFTSSADSGPVEWVGLVFDGGTGDLRHVTVRYGGGLNNSGLPDYYWGSNIAVRDVLTGEVRLESCRVLTETDRYHNRPDYGLYVENSHVVVSDTLFSGNGNNDQDSALYTTGGSVVTVANSAVQHNSGQGVGADGGQITLTCSTVYTNGDDGIRLAGGAAFSTLSSGIYDNAGMGLNNTTGSPVDAAYNWWGDPSGPGGVGPGSGDEVSADVLYDPWLPQEGCACDLQVAKSAAPDRVEIETEDALTYTLTIVNDGPADAGGIVLTDTLPAVVAFGSVTASQGSCSEAGGVVTCQLGDLALGGAATVVIVVAVDPATTGTFSNTVTVTAEGLDRELSNNTANADTTISLFTYLPLALRNLTP